MLARRARRRPRQPQLFRQLVQPPSRPDLLRRRPAPGLRHAARYGTFPLARCRIVPSADGLYPGHRGAGYALGDGPRAGAAAHPAAGAGLRPHSRRAARAAGALRALLVYRCALDRPRPLLINLRALLTRHDPDLLLTGWGDTWLLPRLLELSRAHGLPLPLNRDAGPRRGCREGAHLLLLRADHLPRPAGAPVRALAHRPPQRHAVGRLRPGGRARVGARHRPAACRPPRASRPARASRPCRSLTALRTRACWCPGTSSRPNAPKPPLDLLHADQGGLVYQPIIGLHRDVGKIDFISMYPSIMVRCNISPEVSPAPTGLGRHPTTPPGLVPQTLAPAAGKAHGAQAARC